jgi:hypothetical protein
LHCSHMYIVQYGTVDFRDSRLHVKATSFSHAFSFITLGYIKYNILLEINMKMWYVESPLSIKALLWIGDPVLFDP